jgi:hypothetical protein
MDKSGTRLVAAAALALIAVLAFVTSGGQAQASRAVSGEAYGAFVHTPTATLAKSPLAVLDPTSGMVGSEAASLSAPGVLTAESVSAIASGVVGENAATSQSSSTLQNVNILNGLITAKAVVGMASSAVTRTAADSNAAGSTLAGLTINGVPFVDGAPAPNTRIALPGVGAVILNEQIASGNGLTTTGLTVNMIHVLLEDAVTGAHIGDVIVASGTSKTAFGR